MKLFKGLPLVEVSEEEIRSSLIGRAESRTFDAKLELPGKGSDATKEFLADVTAFANTEGGTIIYGAQEEDTLVVAVDGVVVNDVDLEQNRLLQLVRGIEPKIFGLDVQTCRFSNGRYLFVLEIPKSSSQPHMVTFNDSNRFYMRAATTKRLMDISEIRNAFLQSEERLTSIRLWHDSRVELISRSEGQLPLSGSGIVVLHIVPFSIFGAAGRRNIQTIWNGVKDHEELTELPKKHYSSTDKRLNLDGVLTIAYNSPFTRSNQQGIGSGSHWYGYLQIFRDCKIEQAVSGCFAGSDEMPFIAPVYELGVVSDLEKRLKLLKLLEVEPPLVVMLSLVGIRGAFLADRYGGSISPKIDHDIINCLEVVLTDYDAHLGKAMKDAFDTVWNAGNIIQSPNYEEGGIWYSPMPDRDAVGQASAASVSVR